MIQPFVKIFLGENSIFLNGTYIRYYRGGAIKLNPGSGAPLYLS